MAEPVARTILLFDIERFSRRDDVLQSVLRRALHRVAEDTLATAGVESAQQYREDRGDGLIVLISPEIPKPALLRALLQDTPELLHVHNRGADRSAQIRLRMVLAAGEVAADPQPGTAGGLVGHDLNRAFRLLDSDVLRTALADRPQQECVLAVDAAIHDGVVRHGHRGVRTERFHHVQISAKDGALPAWVYGASAPGDAASAYEAAQPAEQPGVPPRPAPRPVSGPEPRGGAVFHFHGSPTVHGSLVGGDQTGVSGGTIDGDVVFGASRASDERGVPEEGQHR